MVSAVMSQCSVLPLTPFLGSYDAISLGNYITLCKIYGEHIRLCLNSLSLNLLTGQGVDSTGGIHDILPCLERACESAVTLVQHYAQSVGAEPIIRYGGDVRVPSASANYI